MVDYTTTCKQYTDIDRFTARLQTVPYLLLPCSHYTSILIVHFYRFVEHLLPCCLTDGAVHELMAKGLL